MWFKKRKVERYIWPMPETDYEGNDLWELRLPKPQPISDQWLRLASMAQSWLPSNAYAAAMAQQAAVASAYQNAFCYRPSLLSNLFPWI